MTAVAGHASGRAYIGPDGALHLNGATVFDANEQDITDELNAVTGLNTTEVGYIDGVTAGTAAASKAVVLNAAKGVATITSATITDLTTTNTTVTTLTLGSAAINEADITKIDGITNGTAAANKALVLGSAGNITTITSATITDLTTTNTTAALLTMGSAAINEADITKLDAITNGTVAANKAVVPDGSKDIGDFGSLTAVSLKAGKAGTAGYVYCYPATNARGYYRLNITDQTGDTSVLEAVGAMGQNTTFNWGDPGAASVYWMASTNQVSIAEADVLDGAVAGTPTNSKAVVLGGGGQLGTVVSGTVTTLGTDNLTVTNTITAVNNTLGLFGTNAAAQQTLIANATNDPDNLMAQVNSVIGVLKVFGLVASS